MADNVKVQITAEISDLQTKLALAKAEMKSFNSEVTRLSGEMVKSGQQGDAVLGSALRSAATDAAKAGQQVNGFEQELEKLVPTVTKTHGSVATATREFRALFDELSSGRTRMTPGTLAIIANRVFGLQGATLLAAGGVAALALGFGYLIIKSLEAAEAIDKIKVGAEAGVGFQFTAEKIAALRNELDRLPGVTKADADAVMSAFAAMRGTTEADVTALTKAFGLLTDAQGTEAPKAVGKFVEMLEKENLTLTDVSKILPRVSVQSAEQFIAIQKLGNVHQTTAAAIQLLGGYLESQRKDLEASNSSIMKSVSNYALYTGAFLAFGSMEAAHQVVLGKSTKAWEDLAKGMRDAAAVAASQAESGEVIRANADQAAQAVGHVTLAMDNAKRYVVDLEKEIALVKKTEVGAALAADIAKYGRSLKDAKDQLVELQNQQKNKDEMVTRLAGEELIQEARTTNAQIAADDSLNKQEAIQRQIQTWTIILATDKLTAQQRIQVERDLAQTIRQLHTQETLDAKTAALEKEEIARNTAQTDLEISRLGIAEQRELLEQQVQAGRITAQQKLIALRQLAEDELAINLRMLDSSISTYDADAKDFARVENQKRLERAKTAAEIAKINAQIELENNRAARQDVRSWKDAINEIISAEHTLVQGMFSGNESIKMIALRTIDQILEKEIEADLAYLTKHLLFKQEEIAVDKTMEQGGLLVKWLVEDQKTAATAAGEATRLATKEGAAKAGSAVDIASGSASILNDAYKSAAGAYSAVVGIPYVGPIIAPIAAATAFAAVLAFDSLTALETGTLDVPKTQPYMLHQGEAVVPKTFAQGIRETLRSGTAHPTVSATSSSQIAAGDVHLHYGPTINAPERPSLPQLIEKDAAFFRNWVQVQIREGALKIQPT